MQSFTPEELSRFDGKEGRPAYVAFRGTVYDVTQSKKWIGGSHMRRHPAGRDLTADMAGAPHGDSVFNGFSVVGTFDSPAGIPPKKGILDLYFAQHPHPVTVHFPVALTMASAAFFFFYFFTGKAELLSVAFFTLLASTVMSPVAFITGVISWQFNYGRKFTPLFTAKLVLSGVLFVLQGTTLLLWERATGDTSFFLLLAGLFGAMCAAVGVLGKLGAKLTFPD